MDLVTYTVALRKALAVEGVGYTAYAVGLAVASGKARTFIGLKLELGISSKGLRDCVSRRHDWMFTVSFNERPTTVGLSLDGKLKLAAISRRLPLDKAAPPKPRPRTTKANRASSSAQLLLMLQ